MSSDARSAQTVVAKLQAGLQVPTTLSLNSAALAAAVLTSLILAGSQTFGWHPFLFGWGTPLFDERYTAPHLPWDPVLTPAQLQRGIAFYGHGARIERVVARLLAGQPITAVVLGGSVSRNAGASQVSKGYPARFFQFLNATFPHRDHAFLNKAIPGTSSGIISVCAEALVPQNTDLIILEFTANEVFNVTYLHFARRGFEQLLRKVLRLPRSPAVIMLHHYAWFFAAGDGEEAGLFYQSAEAKLSMFAQYYDLPSLSLRNAVWHHMRAGLSPFRVDQLLKPNITTKAGRPLPMAKQEERDLFFYHDIIHPNDLGHQAMAELLAGVVQRSIALAAPVPVGGSQTRAGGAPAAPAAVPHANTSVTFGPRWLPRPMIPNNPDHPTSVCAMQEGFKAMVNRTHGFTYKAERPGAATFVEQKWGFVSERPGDWLELLFSAQGSPDSTYNATVHLGILRSYEKVGLARVQCMSGCTCRDYTLDALWAMQASLTQVWRFEVTPHPRCLLRVTILPRPAGTPAAAQGNKLQIVAIMVAHLPVELRGTSDQVENLGSQAGP